MQQRRIQPFSLGAIPGVMRQQGWTVGARLMERWFSRGVRAMTRAEKDGTDGPSDYDDRIVTMDWALRFNRVAATEQHLLSSWNSGERSALSKNQLAKRFRAWRISNPPPPGQPFRFGDLSRSTNAIDRECQINRDVVESSMFGPVDDFYAAIGKGALKLALSGIATPLPKNRWRLSVNQVGTYLRDTYDFNCDQSLGVWSRSGFTRFDPFAYTIGVDPQLAPEGSENSNFVVSNASFRGYRRHYHRGGDFVVFSDVRRRNLQNPIVVELDG